MKETREITKLDDFNKILLATGTINYLAYCLEGVNKDMRLITQVPDLEFKEIHQEGIKTREYLLRDTASDLYNIMKRLADYMNDSDCISPIDERATEQAFLIVSGTNDNVEE